MALNLIELIKSEFNDDIVGQLGRFVNEEPSKTKAALGAIFPAVLGGVADKGSSPQGASDILNMITKGGFGADSLKGLSGAFMGGDATQNLLNTGMGLLGGIFGDRISKVTDWVSSSSGIGKNSASTLMGLVTPAVFGVLGREVKNSNLNAGGLMNLLAGQTGFIKNLAPAGLAGVVGLSNRPDIAKTASVPAPKAFPYWKSLLLLLILAAILFFLFRTCSMPPVEKATEEVVEEVTTTTEEMTEPVDRLDEGGMVSLPSGIELNVPELGVERKLIDFIEDTSKPVDDTTWFTIERLEFETGSATLKPASAEPLNNIAEIMKAYPPVTLKIGGYTDNTGTPEANLLLSQQRADSTMQELITLGIDATRLEAEGYGENHPVADNATEEGQQMNRRIDIRVTNK